MVERYGEISTASVGTGHLGKTAAIIYFLMSQLPSYPNDNDSTLAHITSEEAGLLE